MFLLNNLFVKKMKKLIIFAFICFCSSILNSQALTQDNSKTTVTFKIRNLGVNVDGNFSKVSINSNFDKNNIDGSFLNATIDVKTIDTDNDTRNKSLSEKKYFDTANHQNITLKSTKIIKVSDTKYTLTGKLTVKATTKTVTIPLTVTEDADVITITADFEINRRDYKVGKSSWVMSDTVKIKVLYVAKK